jgi:hypothetical protein
VRVDFGPWPPKRMPLEQVLPRLRISHGARDAAGGGFRTRKRDCSGHSSRTRVSGDASTGSGGGSAPVQLFTARLVLPVLQRRVVSRHRVGFRSPMSCPTAGQEAAETWRCNASGAAVRYPCPASTLRRSPVRRARRHASAEAT